MTFLSNAKIFLDDIELTGTSTECAIEFSRDELEETTFGDLTKSFKPGLRTAACSAVMFYDTADDGQDEVIYNRMNGSAKPITIYDHTNGFGDVAYVFNTELFEHQRQSTIGQMMKATFKSGCAKNGDLSRGFLMINETITTDKTTTGLKLGAISKSQKLMSNYHILVTNAATCTLKIQGATGSTFAIGDGYEKIDSGTSSNLFSVYYANDVCIFGTSSGSIILRFVSNSEFLLNTTPTQIALPAGSGVIYGLTYNSNLWLAVGSAGQIATSSDNGLTWTARTSGVSGNLHAAVSWNTNNCIVVGALDAGTGIILKSANFITYTRKTSIAFAHNSVTFISGTTFVIVGAGGSILISTDNGEIWTESTDSRVETTNDLNGVAYNGTVACAVGNGGKIITAPSANLNTWTTQTSGTTANFTSITAIGTDFYAVNSSGDSISRSTDNGVTWTHTGSGAAKNAIFGNSKRLITAGTSGDIQTSTSAIDVISHTITGKSSQSLSVDGPIELTYFRSVADITGTSCTLVSAIGIGST